MVIRVAVDTADPYYWVLVRFIIASIVMLPISLAMVKFSAIRKAVKYILIAGVCMALASLLYTQAIYYSQASYVVILTMLTPIILVMVSARLFRERITHRKVAGIALAMAGATVVVLLPFLATNQAGSLFYPLATVLSIAQSILFVGAFIAFRRANEIGVPIIPSVGLTAPVGVVITLPAFLLLGDATQMPNDLPFWLAALYSAIGIAVLFRAVTVVAYRRIGAVSVASLLYLENLLAIILPVMIIGEVISVEMAVGGVLILLGMYLVESHKARRHKYNIAHRH